MYVNVRMYIVKKEQWAVYILVYRDDGNSNGLLNAVWMLL